MPAIEYTSRKEHPEFSAKERRLQQLRERQEKILRQIEADYPKVFTAADGFENCGVLLRTQIEQFKKNGETEEWDHVSEGNPGTGKTTLQHKFLKPLMDSVSEEVYITKGKKPNIHFIGWDEVQKELIGLFKENNESTASVLREKNKYIDFIQYMLSTHGLRRKFRQSDLLRSIPDPKSSKGYPALFHYAVGLRILHKVYQIRQSHTPYTAIFIEKVGNTSYPLEPYKPGSSENKWKIFREYFPELIEYLSSYNIDESDENTTYQRNVSSILLTMSAERLVDISGRDLISFAEEFTVADILAAMFTDEQFENEESWEDEKNTAGSKAVVFRASLASQRLGQFFEYRLAELGFSEHLLRIIKLPAILKRLRERWRYEGVNQNDRKTWEELLLTQEIENVRKKFLSTDPVSIFIYKAEKTAQITDDDFHRIIILLTGMLGAAYLSEDILRKNIGQNYCVAYNSISRYSEEKRLHIETVIKEEKRGKRKKKLI